MEPLPACLLLLSALVGNAAFWITFLNRSHGLGIWRPLVHGCSLLALAGFAGGPFVVLAAVLAASPSLAAALPVGLLGWLNGFAGSPLATMANLYTALCILVALVPVPWWLLSGWFQRDPAQQKALRVRCVDFAAHLAGKQLLHGKGRYGALVPGNEIFQVEIAERTLALQRLPARLEGLTIVHLSDMHMSGRISIDFFHEMVDRTNALAPDLIAITGDIVDSAECLEWIVPTLSRLNAPLGVYGIVGNHDVWVDVPALLTKMAEAGIVNLGGRSKRVEIAGENVLLTGNELPWIVPAHDADEEVRTAGADCSLRILLSHAPDQINWARRRDYDLMLAGHTHGGQIRFPIVGAVLAPSIYGTKYASGLYYKAPTLMHVSRGVSGLFPVRYNCRPEITLIKLVGTNAKSTRDNTAPDAEEALASGS
jgi:predicted MPP superfamily phosphohydrolase